MILNMNIKKKILTGIMALAVATTTYPSALAYVPIGENYHQPASKWETDNFWQKEVQALQRSEYLERSIQAPLVRYNPQKVWKAKAKYDDGLKGVYINPRGTSTDGDIYGRNHGGGYISLTRGSVLVNSAPYYGKGDTTLTPKDYNIYARSAIASDYAHECGHWYYDDPFISGKLGQNQQTVNRDVISIEARADAFGIRLLENVPQFSVGGDLISVRRMARRDGWYTNQGEHPTHDSRWKNTYNYIKQMSNYRVRFEDENSHDDSTFYIRDKKGQDWQIVVPDQYEVADITDINNKKVLYNRDDRARYVMGQVAWAIKNNCWNTKHCRAYKAQDYFPDMPETDFDVNVIVIQKSKTEWKIIDWFVYPKEDGEENYYTETQKQALVKYLNTLASSMD